ncbi:MAG: hypothetical protein HUJ51_05590 [Eggerthellaceae bacterium]|nr:hypothetical protein [Eggerthellaceae bacterium]
MELFACGASFIVSHALGRKDLAPFHLTYIVSFSMFAVITIILGTIVFIFADDFASLFSQVAYEVSCIIIKLIIQHLRLYAF